MVSYTSIDSKSIVTPYFYLIFVPLRAHLKCNLSVSRIAGFEIAKKDVRLTSKHAG